MNALGVTAAVSLVVLCLAWVIALIRFLMGPSLPDRVVALDILTAIGIGILSVHAVVTRQAVFLDVAVILALVTFLGTVAFALYLEKKGPE